MRTELCWVLLGRVVTALIAIASLRIITSLLESKDYGIYALLIAFQGFCGLFLINPVGQHINRHTHRWWDDGTLLKRLAGYNTYILLVSAGIAMVVTLWWLSYPDADKGMTAGLLAAVAVSTTVYLGTWNGTLVYILNMIGFRSGSVVWMTASSIIGLVFSTILTCQYRTASSWMLGQAIGMSVGATGAGLMLRRHQMEKGFIANDLTPLPALLDRQTIMTYCLPLATATGLMWLQNTGYRFWVGSAWGMAELGILVIGLNISSQLWAIVESLAMQFLTPYFFRHITTAKTDYQASAVLSDMVNVMWPLYAIFAGFNMLCASSLLVVLTNDRYYAAVEFVMLGALIEFARCTTNLWSYAAQIERRTTKIILPYGLGAVIVWLSAWGVSYFDGNLNMLATALVISGVVTCATMLVFMQRLSPIVLDVRRWLLGFLILSLALVLLVILPVWNDGLYQNMAVLLVTGTVTTLLMLAMLWRNPALSRLLCASLRSTEKT